MSQYECEQIYGPNYHRITSYDGKEFSVHLTLATNVLMKLHWAKKYRGDCVFFVDGAEGSGKSTLARQLAKLIDPNFSEKNIIYTFEDLKKRFFNGVEWEVIVYDESQEGVDRLSFSSNDNKEFNAFMRQARQAHKILIMCGPSIYDISSYVAQHRVNFLIHCYKQDNIHPGYYLFFNEGLIHKLFIHDKKDREYRQAANFKGTFTSDEVCDMLVYEARKRAAFEKFKNGDSSQAEPKTFEELLRDWKISRLRSWDAMKLRSKNLRVKDVCTVLDISRTTFYELCERHGIYIDNKAMGGNLAVHKEDDNYIYDPDDENLNTTEDNIQS